MFCQKIETICDVYKNVDFCDDLILIQKLNRQNHLYNLRTKTEEILVLKKFTRFFNLRGEELIFQSGFNSTLSDKSGNSLFKGHRFTTRKGNYVIRSNQSLKLKNNYDSWIFDCLTSENVLQLKETAVKDFLFFKYNGFKHFVIAKYDFETDKVKDICCLYINEQNEQVVKWENSFDFPNVGIKGFEYKNEITEIIGFFDNKLFIKFKIDNTIKILNIVNGEEVKSISKPNKQIINNIKSVPRDNVIWKRISNGIGATLFFNLKELKYVTLDRFTTHPNSDLNRMDIDAEDENYYYCRQLKKGIVAILDKKNLNYVWRDTINRGGKSFRALSLNKKGNYLSIYDNDNTVTIFRIEKSI